MNNSQNPIARTENLVIQELPGEVLIYDLETNKAHCLNETAAFVWKSCDGENSFDAIVENFRARYDRAAPEDVIRLALDQLKQFDLLSTSEKSQLENRSRREVIKKIGFAGLIALPAISILTLPQNALANTCPSSINGAYPPCAGGFCCGGTCQGSACSPRTTGTNTRRGGAIQPGGGNLSEGKR